MTKAIKSKLAARTRAWRRKHGDVLRARERNYRLLKRYGITTEERNALIAKQKGLCALCKTVLSTSILPYPIGKNYPCVDHCHLTGRVRGILCVGCNRSLGRLGDTIDSIKRVLSYLQGE